MNLKKQKSPIELKMIGGGSYADVYSCLAPDYGIRFAVKRAKRGLYERDQQRFRQLLTQTQLPGHRSDRPAGIDDKAGSLPPILRSEFMSYRAHKNTFPQNPRIPLLQVSTNRG